MSDLERAAKEYARSAKARFHMPGHKGRKPYGVLPEELYALDITELGFSDELFEPSGAIAELEAEAARVFGSGAALISPFGATSCIRTMADMAGGKVLIPRNSHYSVFNAAGLAGAEVVVLAPPSKYFASVVEGFRGLVPPEALVVSVTKGLCERTNRRMTDIGAEILGLGPVVALAGPSHAEEVARGIPTAVVAACEDESRARRVQEIWSGPRFRVYTSTDPAGVEIGGAVKNVLAIAVGCSDGLGFGDNTRAALIPRGLVEMKRFVLAYGGTPETLSGLAGVGDLIVTCT